MTQQSSSGTSWGLLTSNQPSRKKKQYPVLQHMEFKEFQIFLGEMKKFCLFSEFLFSEWFLSAFNMEGNNSGFF